MEEKTAKSLLDYFNNPNKNELGFIGAKGDGKKREISSDSDDNDDSDNVDTDDLSEEEYNEYKKKKLNNDLDEIKLKTIPYNIKKDIIKYIGNDILKKIVNDNNSKSYWSREAQNEYTASTRTYMENLLNSIVFDIMDLFVYLQMYLQNTERNPEN